jgi:hypothetical protein
LISQDKGVTVHRRTYPNDSTLRRAIPQAERCHVDGTDNATVLRCNTARQSTQVAEIEGFFESLRKLVCNVRTVTRALQQTVDLTRFTPCVKTFTLRAHRPISGQG